MKKYIFAIGVLFFAATLVYANPPSLAIDPIPDMEFASFPQDYIITGDVTHDSATGPGVKNVCRLTKFTVTVDDGINPLVTLLDTTDPTTVFSWSPDCFMTDDWSVPWSISAAGVYTITATSKHVGATGSDEEVTTITEIVVVDSTPPEITPMVTPGANTNGWHNVDVQISWSVSDPESAITSMSGCDPVVLADETSEIILTCEATSAGGTSSESVTIKIDKTKPVIAGDADPDANTNGWNNTDVDVGFICADTGVVQSGIDIDTVVGETLTTEGAGQSVTNTGDCIDMAGNAADSAMVSDINIDKTAPIVIITTPADGVSYTYNQTILAEWSISDALSGIDGALATSTTANGVAISTTPVEPKLYVVTATDLAGNTTSLTNNYSVVAYTFCGVGKPVSMTWKDWQKLSTLPVKFCLTDTFGNRISNATGQLWVDGIAAVSSGSSNVGNYFRYDPLQQQYIYNASTKSSFWTIGTHILRITLDDGTSYTITATIMSK